MKRWVRRPWVFKVWTAAAYQAGWFACVLGAAHGLPWLGPPVVAGITLFHLLLVPDPLREAWLLALCAVFGFGVDSFHGYLGVLVFHPGTGVPWFAPAWLVAIWVAFGITLHGCLDWLLTRIWLGVLLGALGGPLAYWAGSHLGASSFGPGLLWDLGVVGIVWAIAAAVLTVFARLTRWAPLPR